MYRISAIAIMLISLIILSSCPDPKAFGEELGELLEDYVEDSKLNTAGTLTNDISEREDSI